MIHTKTITLSLHYKKLQERTAKRQSRSLNILICLKAKVQMLVSSVGMIMTSELLRPLRGFRGWGVALGLPLDFATCPNE